MYILEGFRLKCVFTSMIAYSYFSLNVVPWYTTGSKKIVLVSDISGINFIACRAVGWSKFTCSFNFKKSTTSGLLEGVNGVNRLATKGEKYYWLPTKRVKNYRLQTRKTLTDYRHGLTLSIFVSEKRAFWIFFLAVRNSNLFKFMTHQMV